MPETPKATRMSAEMITALTAVIIGVAAVGVSLYQTTLIRQQVRGSAWPYVEGGYSYNDEGFRYILTNSGVGPARIRHAEITVDGEPVLDWREFFDRLGLDVNRFITSYLARGALPAGTIHEVLTIGRDEPIDALYHLQHRVGMSICYCSVYDDCWVRTLAVEPAPVRACPEQPDRRFRN